MRVEQRDPYTHWMYPVILAMAAAMAAAVSIPQNFLEPTVEPMFTSVNHPQPPNPDYWGSVNRPLPTNTWWMNFVIDMGEAVVAPLPLQVKASPQGMVICFPWVDVSETAIIPPFISNMMVQIEEPVESRKIVAYDDLSATLEWRKSGGGGSMSSPIVRGAPYMTFVLDNATPVFSTVHAIVDIDDPNPTGTRFVVNLNNRQRWLIYTSEDITLSYATNRIETSQPFTGVIRVAVVPPGERIPLNDLTPNTSFEEWLDRHKDTYPIGGKAHLEYEGDRSTTSFEFETASMGTGAGELLMMALPHHLDTALTTAGMGNVYRTAYGFMTGVVGDKWDLSDDLPTVEWYSIEPIDPTKIDDIRDALLEDVPNLTTNAQDPYFYGKELAAMARLALIADHLGEDGVAEECRRRVKEAYLPWLTATNDDAFQYDQDWGGLPPSQGLMDVRYDFGAGWYNDHHFHQGYHIYAAAVIAKEDPEFLQEYKSRLLAFVRNFANPNQNDLYFTHARHKDFYAGHSWAAGVVSFGERCNQESTSEAINAYYGVTLLGMAMGDTNLEMFGRLMLGSELKSAAKYWQITSMDTIYPSPFADNKVVGIRWATKADYATFFGANTEFIFGIQFLPFTPVSELHLRKSWMEEAYPNLSTALSRDDLGSGWRGFIYMAHAVIDPVAAWEEVTNELDGAYDNGNSRTNTLYWVATRPSGDSTPSPTPSPTPTPSPQPSPSPPTSTPPMELTEREKYLAEFIINSVMKVIGKVTVDQDDVMELSGSTGGASAAARRLSFYEMTDSHPTHLSTLFMTDLGED